MEGEGKRPKRGIAAERKGEAHVRGRNERAGEGGAGRERRGRGREGKGWGEEARGYRERTSQVAVKWRIIIVASSVSRIVCRTSVIKLPGYIAYSARRRVKKLPSQVPEIPAYGTNGFYAEVHSF